MTANTVGLRQDGIRVFHPHKAGMRYDGQVMFNGERLDSSADDTAPILIIGTDEILNRLVAKNISADNHGNDAIAEHEKPQASRT